MEKIHVSFASELLLPSSTLTDGSNFQLQRALLIYETFLAVFSYFLGILEVFFLRLLRFTSNNAMEGRDVQNKAQERIAHITRSADLQRTTWLKISVMILSRT